MKLDKDKLKQLALAGAEIAALASGADAEDRADAQELFQAEFELRLRRLGESDTKARENIDAAIRETDDANGIMSDRQRRRGRQAFLNFITHAVTGIDLSKLAFAL